MSYTVSANYDGGAWLIWKSAAMLPMWSVVSIYELWIMKSPSFAGRGELNQLEFVLRWRHVWFSLERDTLKAGCFGRPFLRLILQPAPFLPCPKSCNLLGPAKHSMLAALY